MWAASEAVILGTWPWLLFPSAGRTHRGTGRPLLPLVLGSAVQSPWIGGAVCLYLLQPLEIFWDPPPGVCLPQTTPGAGDLTWVGSLRGSVHGENQRL